MKKLSLLVFLTMLLVHPGFGFAHNMDEKQGNEGMQGMHEGMQSMHEEDAATLREAASLLRGAHPDLAARLEKMAQHHESMKS